MHVISADTTVADMIRYDTPSIGSDTIPTDPIIVCSLVEKFGKVMESEGGPGKLLSMGIDCSVIWL